MGGGDLQEALGSHSGPDGGDHVAPEDDVFLYRRVTQIQIAVFQPGIFIGIPGLVDLKGQGIVVALAQNGNCRGGDLNVASGPLKGSCWPAPGRYR